MSLPVSEGEFRAFMVEQLFDLASLARAQGSVALAASLLLMMGKVRDGKEGELACGLPAGILDARFRASARFASRN